ncbi:STAS domain-containing protein [Luteolibacter pohnpeiensis]|uniref:STAS domain-containing protein n=1 Tax=Luteolibacter pohnpeiensis TaxID=454153 RepID=A0A934VWF0_9BACT|nr:STAS domain-containing protein [Luteolibacter pohnpeiensis]
MKIRINTTSLDRSNAVELREAAAGVITPETKSVEIDCDDLKFIDSSGVGALLHINNLLPPGSGPAILTKVHGTVLTVLELVRVHRLFTITD